MIENLYCLKLGKMYLKNYDLDAYNKNHCVEFCLDKDDAIKMNYDEKDLVKGLVELMLDVKLESEMK